MTFIFQGIQVLLIFRGFENNGATIATITTIRAAKRHKLLATETAATVAAITAFNFYIYLIYEHIKVESGEWRVES